MPWKDPDLLGRYGMAVAGGSLYGLYLFAIKMRSGGQLTRKDFEWLILNVICSVLTGLILTHVLADRVVAFIPWASLRDAGLAAFAFGVFGWELLPLLFPKAMRWAETAVDKAGGRPMTTMDMVAASAGGLAFGWLAIRANMLKPRFDSWCSAPTLVWLSLLVLAVTCGIIALSIVRTGVHATARETLLLVVLSATSLAMLVNLHRQAPGATATAPANEEKG